jgi:hypothetical protein
VRDNPAYGRDLFTLFESLEWFDVRSIEPSPRKVAEQVEYSLDTDGLEPFGALGSDTFDKLNLIFA